jgi:transposase
MHLKSILNRVEPLKSFVYKEQRLVESAGGQPCLEVDIEPRANSRPICSVCGKKRPGYDRLPARQFQFVPFWNIAVVFVYAMRRVNCPTCGVIVEKVPWSDGKEHLTTSYRWFLARWARRLSWSETANAFNTSWENVFRSVKHAVSWGLDHRDLSGIEAIGVDEIQWRSGHTYLTLVYQTTGLKRLLWVSHDRTEQSLRQFFESLKVDVRTSIRFVCSDMWKPYLNVIAEQIPQALHVLDRFHIMRNMNMAIDEVRRTEVTQLQKDGYEPALTKSRWCLLKRPENLTDSQATRLAELLRYNLKSVRAHLLREEFQRFWEFESPTWAGKFLSSWCTGAMRSQLKPMKRVAKSLRHHRPLILNWFHALGTISSGIVEGFNGKAKLTTRKAYGFRTPKGIEFALFHVMGHLPEPESTHRFC